jgi:hypothetical protein
MRRVAVFLASAALAAVAACSPPGPGPSNEPSLPPPPTAPVGADGQPIRTLCDLLNAQDFNTVAGVDVKAPDTSKATQITAECDYAKNVRMVVSVAGSADDATRAFATASSGATFAKTEQDTMAGVDQSVSGTGTDRVGIAVRRRMLVFSIELPAGTQEGKFKLIQLSGRLLERAHALGA